MPAPMGLPTLAGGTYGILDQFGGAQMYGAESPAGLEQQVAAGGGALAGISAEGFLAQLQKLPSTVIANVIAVAADPLAAYKAFSQQTDAQIAHVATNLIAVAPEVARSVLEIPPVVPIAKAIITGLLEPVVLPPPVHVDPPMPFFSGMSCRSCEEEGEVDLEYAHGRVGG